MLNSCHLTFSVQSSQVCLFKCFFYPSLCVHITLTFLISLSGCLLNRAVYGFFLPPLCLCPLSLPFYLYSPSSVFSILCLRSCVPEFSSQSQQQQAVCVCVCPSFHTGRQRESGSIRDQAFVISFPFPSLHSAVPCCKLPPFSSTWKHTHTLTKNLTYCTNKLTKSFSFTCTYFWTHPEASRHNAGASTGLSWNQNNSNLALQQTSTHKHSLHSFIFMNVLYMQIICMLPADVCASVCFCMNELYVLRVSGKMDRTFFEIACTLQYCEYVPPCLYMCQY